MMTEANVIAPFRKALLDRFLRYVRIDTQSQEEREETHPSSEGQKELAALLVQELCDLGLDDAKTDDFGIVTATLQSNLPSGSERFFPVIGLLAHLDTSPEVPGCNVHHLIHADYSGGDLPLSESSGQVIRFDDNPELARFVGDTLITSDGSTLLGADNKAGIAEIMTMLDVLQSHPEIRRGTLRIAFTPDEEVGRGTAHFDIPAFGADVAYTVDGGSMGEIENETFNGAVAECVIRGRNVHPGYARGRMVNALRIAAEFIAALGKEVGPEQADEREGYLHPYNLDGGVERAALKILLRDFDADEMVKKAFRLGQIQRRILQRHPDAVVEMEIREQYRNMKAKLDANPRVVDCALEAVHRTGVEPVLKAVRGGTDGARLTELGLLTPNIFTGGMNFHSRHEWIALGAMEKAVETLVHLIQIWVEEGARLKSAED